MITTISLGDISSLSVFGRVFFFNDTATTEIYTLSLHDALPIPPTTSSRRCSRPSWCCRHWSRRRRGRGGLPSGGERAEPDGVLRGLRWRDARIESSSRMTHYDLIVIGSGPAGEKGAAQAAYFGKRVTIVEQAPEVGGTGINTGTIPSKTLRETALYFSGLHQRGLYGVDHRVAKDLTVNDFLYREREVVRSLGSLVLQNIERHHIDLVHERASFEDPHTI